MGSAIFANEMRPVDETTLVFEAVREGANSGSFRYSRAGGAMKLDEFTGHVRTAEKADQTGLRAHETTRVKRNGSTNAEGKVPE